MVATEKKKTSLARAVFSGSLGNMLEWFDYGLYGYFAAIISADFFVADDPIVGLLLSFLVFGTGFLVRPIGGVSDSFQMHSVSISLPSLSKHRPVNWLCPDQFQVWT